MSTTGDVAKRSDCTLQLYSPVILSSILILSIFCRETFIEREPGESANDRNDRAIRVAAKWYSEHLKGCGSDGGELRVVLLTNDLGNKQKAEENKLLVYKCKCLKIYKISALLVQRGLLDYVLGEDYVKSLIANPELVDRLALSADDKVDAVMMFPGVQVAGHLK